MEGVEQIAAATLRFEIMSLTVDDGVADVVLRHEVSGVVDFSLRFGLL